MRQVPFEDVVQNVQQQLKAITSGELVMHVPVHKEERSFQTFRFVAIALDGDKVLDVLQEVCPSGIFMICIFSFWCIPHMSRN